MHRRGRGPDAATQHCSPKSTPRGAATLTTRFADRLHELFVTATEQETVQQIPGAAEFLRRLVDSPDWLRLLAVNPGQPDHLSSG